MRLRRSAIAVLLTFFFTPFALADNQPFKGRFEILQVLSPGKSLAHQSSSQPLTGVMGQSCDRVVLLVGIPSDLADGDSWNGAVVQGDNFTYTGVDGATMTVHSCRVLSDQEVSAAVAKQPPPPEQIEVCWAVEGHMQVGFELPEHLAEALKAMNNLAGPITVAAIKGVQAGDLHAADWLATGLNDQDKALLIEVLKAARLSTRGGRGLEKLAP